MRVGLFTCVCIQIMIWIAILAEAVNGIVLKASDNWTDVGVLFGLQLVNGLVGWFEERKASDAIAALKKSLAPMAHVKRDGKWSELAAVELVPGDIVSLVLGGAIPADCRIMEGQGAISVDQAALTGESMPVKMKAGDTAKMGSSVSTGECEAIVVATGAQTFFGKTAHMISSVDKMGHVQYILWLVALVLTVASVLVVASILTYLLVKGQSFFKSLSVCVVILVASIPIAQEVVCTSTLAIGARHLASAKSGGAIVSRLAAIEELAGMQILCSDKTGTLTTGKLEMQKPLVLAHEGVMDSDVVRAAMLAAKWHEKPRDAIDRLIDGAKSEHDRAFLQRHEQLDYEPFDPTTKRTLSTVRARSGGAVFKVVKGAPQVVIDMCNGGSADLVAATSKVAELAERGVRALAVAWSVQAEGGWDLLGILTFLDPPRHDTALVIRQAHELGIQVKMVTGDQRAIAKDTCSKLALGTNVLTMDDVPGGTGNGRFGEMCLHADGFAEVFPEHKFDIVETMRKGKWTVGMTGDGVNDAPALKRADCGIAVQGATDAARAAADIVLTSDGLSTIITAIVKAREIFHRLRNYVIYRVACTIQLVCFFFFAVLVINNFSGWGDGDVTPVGRNSSGTATFSPTIPSTRDDTDYNDGNWKGAPETYFMLPVFALVLITILNDGTIISIAYDNVEPSHEPEVWRLERVFVIAAVLGFVACVSSLLLCYEGTLAPKGESFIFNHWLGFDKAAEKNPLTYYQLQALLYLKISLSDFLTVFSARTQGFFFSRRPGTPLLCAAGFSMTVSTLLAAYWPFGAKMDGLASALGGVGWHYIGLVWLYCIAWWLIQDAAKVAAYAVLNLYSKHCGMLCGGGPNVEEVRNLADYSNRRQSLASEERSISLRHSMRHKQIA